MLLFSICAVCLNLLILAHPAEPTFMITANLEDLKNIAKKYLTEATVDKIAEYISKARLKDISEENEQTFSGETDIDDAPQINDRPDDNQLTEEENNQEETPKQLIYHNQETIRKETPKQLIYHNQKTIQKETPKQLIFHNQKTIQKETPKQLIYHNQKTIQKETPKKLKYHYQGPAPVIITTKVKNIGRMGPSPPKKNKIYKLTTQKRKNEEFDQYENTNYERTDVVATSGNMRLSALRGFNDRKSQRQ